MSADRMEKDDLSLLSRMTAQERKKQHNKGIWLNMRSGELREQELGQGFQQRFPSSSHVVNKFKEAQIQWQVVL